MPKSLPFRRLIPTLCLSLAIFAGLPCQAERGYVLVKIEDTANHPVRGVEIGIEGAGGSKITDDQGKARLPLGGSTKENDWLPLVILHSPAGRDFVIISPWDNRAQVPSFADKPENFVRVVVVQRGDRAALENGSVLISLAEKINKANSPKSAKEQALQEDPKVALDAVAKQYGLSSDEVDQAIRAWGAKTTDPYEAGLAALYERDYPKASAQLGDSLKQREEKLTADQKMLAQDQQRVADVACFLGQSLFVQGKYREAAQAFERCLQIRPNDAKVLNNTAASLDGAGNEAEAEPLLRRALDIDEKELGPYHPDVANVLSNLAGLLLNKGDYAGAELFVNRALAIDEKSLEPDHPGVATDLSTLAKLLEYKGDYVGAEPLLRRALAIDEKALGPNHPIVATDLINLAELLRAKGRYAEAEPLYNRALTISEKALGPEHPQVANVLNNLAQLLEDKGDYVAAEPLYSRALAIDEKALGPDHEHVGRDLNNLGELLCRRGDYAGAEPMLSRALAITEKAQGTDHPHVASALNNLARLLQAKGDYARAEPLYRRAIAIDEKTLGPDHPTTKLYRANLDALLAVEKKKEK